MNEPGIVGAAILPHGGIAVERWCDPAERDLATATRRAAERVGAAVRATSPDVVVVVTPHNVHVEGHLAVVTAARHAGALEDSHEPVELAADNDVGLAAAILTGLRDAGIPALGVSFGSNDPAVAEMPMDWATLIPLLFVRGGDAGGTPAVVVSTSRDVDGRRHVRAGRAIADAARAAGRRVALVVSADHAHTHDADGPFGFDPAAAEYDARVVELVRDDRLDGLLDLDPALIRRASADSWWQLLVLHGALGAGWRADLLSYEAPTYFGMACVLYTTE